MDEIKEQRRKILRNSKSDLQLKVIELNYGQFISSTNIKSIVEKQYRKSYGLDAEVPHDVMEENLRAYFEMRTSLKKWWLTSLKDIKLLPSMKDAAAQTDIKYVDKETQCNHRVLEPLEKQLHMMYYPEDSQRFPFNKVQQNVTKKVEKSTAGIKSEREIIKDYF